MAYADSEKAREYKLQWRRADRLRNPEKYRRQFQEWMDRNREKRRAWKRKHWAEMTDEQRKHANQRRLERIYRTAESHERRKNVVKNSWRRASPAQRRARYDRQLKWLKDTGKGREYNSRRRARKSAATTEDCTEKIKGLQLTSFCHWCSCILTVRNRCVDHVIPIYRGGYHKSDNLVASCRRCNVSKGSKFYWEWDEELAA